VVGSAHVSDGLSAGNIETYQELLDQHPQIFEQCGLIQYIQNTVRNNYASDRSREYAFIIDAQRKGITGIDKVLLKQAMSRQSTAGVVQVSSSTQAYDPEGQSILRAWGILRSALGLTQEDMVPALNL